MNKKQLIAVWAIILILLVIVFQIGHIAHILDNIDWDMRNILGKIN